MTSSALKVSSVPEFRLPLRLSCLLVPSAETFVSEVARLDVVLLDVLQVLLPTIFGALGSGVSEAGDANAAAD